MGNLKTRENELLTQILDIQHAKDRVEMENRKINETVQKQSGIKQEHYVEVERLRQEISKRSKEYEGSEMKCSETGGEDMKGHYVG